MPANSRPPVSPTSTAKYANKDRSKYITVPKTSPLTEQPQPVSPTLAAMPALHVGSGPSSNGPPPAVNQKKQKRRQKMAAKAAAAANGHQGSARGLPDEESVYVEDTGAGVYEATPMQHVQSADTSSIPSIASPEPSYTQSGVFDSAAPREPAKAKKKSKKNAASSGETLYESESVPALQPMPGVHSDEKFWNANSHEERERIREFWLGLSEDDRKGLVKVEKETVVRKMKEQQKNTCNCTVCGRKQIAIQQELEGLYDSYYRELEEFANSTDGSHFIGGPRDFALRPPRALPTSYQAQSSSRGRIVEHMADDDDEDDDDDDEDDDDPNAEEEYSEGESEEDDEYSDDFSSDGRLPNDRDVADFLTFGNSLQVKGGILTVADDLLKNDGRRFIEMMEQLAERRMAREDDTMRDTYPRGFSHGPNGTYVAPHEHDSLDDELDQGYDDVDDEGYDDSQDADGGYDDDEDDLEDPLTEEKRMEESRRMFQIFAARMFEQRVLTAYKKKVSEERSAKLLKDLEEEARAEAEKKAQKATKAQKKRDRERQKKQAAAEAKAKKESEKAAEEAAKKAEAERKAEDQKVKAEEKRKAKEAQRKAEEEEKTRKEADRQRRIQEQERKAREAREREKKLKDEQRSKEREAREQRDKERKEREARERRDKQESLERQRKEREAKAWAATNAKERQAQQDRAPQRHHHVQAAIPKAPSAKQRQHQAVPLQPALSQHPHPSTFTSPKIPVATPMMSKGPTPMRSRNASQQHDSTASTISGSQGSSVPSQNASPLAGTPLHTSPGPGAAPCSTGTGVLNVHHVSQSTSPSTTSFQGLIPTPPPQYTPGRPVNMPPPPGFQGPPPPPPPPGLQSRVAQDPMFVSGHNPFRFGTDAMPPMPPGFGTPLNRGFPGPAPPGFPLPAGDPFGISHGFPMPLDMRQPTHTRQPSGGHDFGPTPVGPPHVSRPAPIGRPGSVVHGQRTGNRSHEDIDEHLGSKALLDDAQEDVINPAVGVLRQRTSAPGPAPRPPYPQTGFMEGAFALPQFSQWAPAPAPGSGHFAPPPGLPTMWSTNPSQFSAPGPAMPPVRSRPQVTAVVLRRMLWQACETLRDAGRATPDGYVDFATVKSNIDLMTGHEVSEDELLAVSETEGNSQNGGGTFDGRIDGDRRLIRFNLPSETTAPLPIGAPGDIGSPGIGSGAGRGS